MRPVFYPYKMKSASAKQLAQAFGAERVKPDGKFMNNYKRPVINWGNSDLPAWMTRWQDQVILNHPKDVAKAANKLSTFVFFKKAGVKHPEWTTDLDEANMWKTPVLVRTTLVGKGGAGCYYFESLFDLEHVEWNHPPIVLYTKYFKKKEEYRVHVVDGKIVDYVMKKKREGEEVNYQIRNADNGWVFCREGVVLPDCVAQEAVKAVAALGLTFGAVDVGYNVAKNEPCVFEVNSAPGIEGQTVESYVKAFKELLK